MDYECYGYDVNDFICGVILSFDKCLIGNTLQ